MAHLGLKMGIFGQFGLEVGRPRDQKTLKNKWFLIIFDFSDNLPNKRPLDQFVGQLGLHLGVQNPPKSLQDANIAPTWLPNLPNGPQEGVT